jgi:hypothetical protein
VVLWVFFLFIYLYLFLFHIFILFYFTYFEVLDIIWSYFLCQGKASKLFGRGFLHLILFCFSFLFLGGKDYVVPYGTVVTGILDMRPGKHDLHFLVSVELLPHSFMNIPDEKMNIGVFRSNIYYSFYIYFFYIFFYILILFIYIFVCSFLPIRIWL